MAKASRVAARTAKKMASMEERIQRIELMLDVMLTAKQRSQYEALLAAMEAETQAEALPSNIRPVATAEGDMEIVLEAADAEPEAV